MIEPLTDQFWAQLVGICKELKPQDRNWLDAAYAEYGGYSHSTMPLAAYKREIETAQNKARALGQQIDRIFNASAKLAGVKDNETGSTVTADQFSNFEFQNIISKLLKRLESAPRRKTVKSTDINRESLLVNRLLYLFCLRKHAALPRSWKETSTGPRFHSFLKLGLGFVFGQGVEESMFNMIGEVALKDRVTWRLIIDDIIDDLPIELERD